MDTKRIMIIIGAVFTIGILLTNNNIEKVYALEAVYYNVVLPRDVVEILDGVTSSAFGSPSTSKFIGEEITTTSGLVGQRINRIGIHMEKVTDGQELLGTVYVGFWGNSAEPTLSNTLKIFGSMPANSVTDSNTQFNFTLATGNYTITANSVVGAFYIDPLGSGSGSDGIFISAKAGTFDGVQTRATCHVNNSTSTADCFSIVVCTLGCGGQWSDDTTKDVIMLMSATTVINPSGSSTACIDTTGDTQTDICFTDTNGDGVPDAGAGGALAAHRSLANATQFGSDLGCAFGLTSCTDKNVKTNGVGLAYFAIIIIWSYAFLVFVHYQAKKVAGEQNIHLTEILNIHPMLLVVMLLMDVGITFYLGWIPDIVFYTTILALIGFFSFGIYRHIRSGG